MPDYSVTISGAAGSRTLPIGTLFPPAREITYDEAAKVQRVTTLFSFQGRFQEATETANFNKFFDLLNFARDSGKVSVQFKFGAATLLTLATNARGPRIRNCRLVHRPGSLATHAEFQLDLEHIEDPTTTSGKSGLANRLKSQDKYDGRLQSTAYRVTATGKDAKSIVLAFKPSDNAGPIQEATNQGIDDLSYEAIWKIETPHKVGAYLSWERDIEITEFGSPLLEIPVLGKVNAAGNIVAFGPVIRQMPNRASIITDSNTIITLGKWRSAIPQISPLLSPEFRDPTRSRHLTGPQLIDPQKDIWRLRIQDVYVVPNATAPLAVAVGMNSGIIPPTAADIKEPKDAAGWSLAGA